ncbi:hypothetical protein ACSYAD_34395 [Acaryochloris marina NIES-2412]|uniref:hypothetical protein n=1 Tax=Acaryochloris marina TaxID=155978 RepID=UPI00405912DF
MLDLIGMAILELQWPKTVRLASQTSPTMITFSPTTADRILKLRHQVLRPGLPIAEVIFPEDQDQETRHYGAFSQQGEVICCVTLIPSTWHGEAAWRLRAMAMAQGWSR